MDWKIWLSEHIVEIVSLLVAIAGFGFAGFYLKKISVNQNITLTNSNNNTIFLKGNIEEDQLNQFRKKAVKEISFPIDSSFKKTEIEDTQALLNKIKTYLEEEKSVSTIAEMCLRLAKKLNSVNDVAWLNKEVNGFFSKKSEGGLDFEKTRGEEFKDYRRIEVKLYLQTKQQLSPEEFSLRMFISQPLREIEFWADQNPNLNPMVMKAAPLKLMVDTFGVSPDEKVPYNVDGTSIKKILVGARIELNKFIEKSEEKFKKR